MLEEKNDNLQDADGKAGIEINDSIQSDAVETSDSEVTPENEISLTESTVENTEEVTESTHQTALDAITNSNAEESEDETLKERHDIPMQDYDTFSLDALVDELKKLVNTDKTMSVKDHIEEIKKAFLLQYNHLIEEKKEEFNNSKQDPNEEFEYLSPLKSKFDEYYNVFREKRNAHFKHLQTNLKSNLENRLAIVEELKELINPQENIKDTLKHFNDLRERWKNAGAIPKDKYNHVWNNYHFHVENFYDYLHLDREARDLDFKYNLDQKQKIVARVEELVNEIDISKAFRELQDLHRIWKEDIGPVSKEHRDTIWNKFSELTKKIHDKRELLFEGQRANEQENLVAKKEIIAKIEVLGTEKVNSHSQWLLQIQKVEALRNEFFAAGKVPSDVNEETWAAFKNAVRNFNSFKNSFYKDIKKDQNDNLNKKMALVAKAKELQESTDFGATTPVMKQIQEEWKQIGHVPKKYSDKIWKEFKDACNHYFDKLKEHKSEENGDEVAAFDNKKAYLDILRAYQLTGDHKTDLDAIKLHIETWKGYGKVPFSRRHIEGKFNKILDALFEKLSLSKKETEMMRFSKRIDSLSDSNDTRKLDNEKIFLMRKIEEVQNEIFQLENNIQFFTNTKNAKKENSIVLEVRKNIAIHKESLEVWKDKLKQLRNLGQE
ncbi:chromosome segregation protein [Flavobacteriaceae bacterium CRH]|nr:chromosome segregation protein [Flavobacteriaceae bacterium CRH]